MNDLNVVMDLISQALVDIAQNLEGIYNIHDEVPEDESVTEEQIARVSVKLEAARTAAAALHMLLSLVDTVSPDQNKSEDAALSEREDNTDFADEFDGQVADEFDGREA